MSLMEIMIDNCLKIFGDDDISFKDIQIKSDTAGKSPAINKAINCHSGKTCEDPEALNIECVALQDEVSTGKMVIK